MYSGVKVTVESASWKDTVSVACAVELELIYTILINHLETDVLKLLKVFRARKRIAVMKDFEKLGVFYMGREYDLAAKKEIPKPVLYPSKDLVTHAVCVGMTGSGKTGLCLTLLEEAAIDGIPALVIDPKGDLANLMLTFPDLKGEDFEPWVNTDDARKKGVAVKDTPA